MNIMFQNILAQGGIHCICVLYALLNLFHAFLLFNFSPSLQEIFNCCSIQGSFATIDTQPTIFLHSTSSATSPVVVAAHGMFRLTLAPRGPSEHFYQIFISPLHRHLSLAIILFLVEVDTSWTLDTFCFATTCRFLWLETRRFRQVDTPSVASVESDD